MTLINRITNYIGRKVDRAASVLRPTERNRAFCSDEERWVAYFKDAEGAMERQWTEMIWPQIQDFDFSVVLELAAGAGRNTERLAEHASVIHAVDFNAHALEKINERFRDYSGDCTVEVHRNDGSNVEMIASDSITTVYCWDSAVHFDKAVVEAYVAEFARVMQPGARGFFHHSNLGATADVEIKNNQGWRSNMSAALMRDYCQHNGLVIDRQVDRPWEGGVVDCITLFSKP